MCMLSCKKHPNAKENPNKNQNYFSFINLKPYINKLKYGGDGGGGGSNNNIQNENYNENEQDKLNESN